MGARVAGVVVIAGVFALLGFGGCKADCPKDDANACTLDLCEGGETVYEPMPNGATCHVGALIGVCVERTCVLSCSGQKGECDDKNPCTADECVEPSKTCVHVNVGLSPPEDGNECTYGVCIGGQELHLPKNDWTPCGEKGVCKQGICSACSAASDCGKDAECMTWTCESGACVPKLDAEGKYIKDADIDGDCRQPECDAFGNVVEILYEGDEPGDDNSACTKELCAGWTPYHQPLAEGSFCPGGVCDANGACVECTTDLHCGSKYCFAQKCYECDNGIQDGNEADVDCGGSCPKCAGEPCGKDSECKTGYCADGVCCAEACGTCRTCVSPGFIGQCKIVPKYGEEPPACSIASGTMCNGAAACKIALGFLCVQGFQCASGICKSGLCAAMP